MPFDALSQPDSFNISGPVVVSADPNVATADSSLSCGPIKGGQGALQTITDSGTLTIANLRSVRATVSAGATATAIVIPTGVAGQEINILNENATAASTLIIATNVAANVTISGLTGAKLVYDAGTSKWVKV